MVKKFFERKEKEDYPVLAICYDFDKTLSPDDMQAQGFIQAVGYDAPDFWNKSNSLAADNEMDQNLAYMYTMMKESEGLEIFSKKTLEEYGSKVKFFPGVESWFKRIQEYGQMKGVIVEHYIISSGLKEMIEGTSIVRNGAFKKIYASSFYYNERGIAVWPAQVVNYTNKTQFLFRIEKGVLDANDSMVNESFPKEKIRVPFTNMVYIGDSDTDIPCMKLVHSNGGYSIGVFNNETKEKSKVYKMMRDKRIGFFAPADYSEGSNLEFLVQKIIDNVASRSALEALHFDQKNEQIAAEKNQDASQQKKVELINQLEFSRNFVTTHIVIQDMLEIMDWTSEERKQIFRVALQNDLVRYSMGDSKVRDLYSRLLEAENGVSPEAQEIKKLLEDRETKQNISL